MSVLCDTFIQRIMEDILKIKIIFFDFTYFFLTAHCFCLTDGLYRDLHYVHTIQHEMNHVFKASILYFLLLILFFYFMMQKGAAKIKFEQKIKFKYFEVAS